MLCNSSKGYFYNGRDVQELWYKNSCVWKKEANKLPAPAISLYEDILVIQNPEGVEYYSLFIDGNKVDEVEYFNGYRPVRVGDDLEGRSIVYDKSVTIPTNSIGGSYIKCEGGFLIRTEGNPSNFTIRSTPFIVDYLYAYSSGVARWLLDGLKVPEGMGKITKIYNGGTEGFDFSFVTCNFNSTEVALVDYLQEGKSHFVGVTAHYSNGEVSDMAKLQVVVGG